LCYGVAAYLAWGVFPLYFQWVLRRGISSLVLVSHRIIWALLFLLLVISVQKQWLNLRRCIQSKKAMIALAGSTVMIALNWFVFVYAIETHQVLQAGLGYYINPLANVLLGFVFLRERLRKLQWIGIALAALGVTILTLSIGKLPWIPFALVATFALYGLLRKTMPAGPLIGLTIETILLFPIATTIALVRLHSEMTTGPAPDPVTYGLLSLSGVLTAMPLLWFAAAARRLRLATMGFLQYLGPSLQTLIAVWCFGEPFRQIQWITFGLIWSALILYSIDSVRALNEAREQAVAQERRREAASEIE
jgi:chloramphenicol-sensitive protein RarD